MRSSDLVEEFVLKLCENERARKMIVLAWRSQRFLKVVKYAMKNGMKWELIEKFGCLDTSDPDTCVKRRICRGFVELLQRYPNILRKNHVRLGEICDEIRSRRQNG